MAIPHGIPPTGSTSTTKVQKGHWVTRGKAWYGARLKKNWPWVLFWTLIAVVVFIVVLAWLLSLLAGCVENARNLNAVPPPTPGVTATVTGPAVSPTPDPTSAPASPSPPSPTSSSSPANCNIPQEASRKLAINQILPASETKWMESFKGTGVTRIVYNGEPVNADVMRNWVNAAACNGFVAEIRPDKVNGGNGQVTPSAAGTLCWDDWPATGRCAPGDYLPVFLPYPGPNAYGSEGDYTRVGQAATSGWAAVQAFSWRESVNIANPDPAQKQFVDRMGFPEGRPDPAKVADFARMLKDNGVSNVMIYHENSDVKYLTDVARGVRQVLDR